VFAKTLRKWQNELHEENVIDDEHAATI